MKNRVIVNGAQGKLGAVACKAIEEHPDFDLVGKLGRQDMLDEQIKKLNAEIVIDVTRADVVYKNAKTIIACNAHPIIGTSGLMDDEITELSRRCHEKKLGGIIVPNFSIGAVLMMKFASCAAKYFPEVEIIETHHQAKLDAPSGTAMKTADIIAKHRKQVKNTLSLKELVQGVRGGEYQDVTIHSLRLPGVLAKQDIIFGAHGETLTLSHNSIDRQAFIPGIILACQNVQQFDTLEYGLESILTE
ncbi:MAG: 4-hydroxy-tetrahydrodipicolinate reductase [Alphaproteobacteria bacterium]|nr:4-hydroxy-tetrahydrodipicolinate reductase [Alphaproteobacteria bacterium]